MPISLYRLPVSKGAKLVLSYLWRYAGREPFVWVDRETIASDLGIDNDRTMRRLLGELRTAGAVEEDEQLRQGRVRRGWWLWDGRDVGTGDVVGEEDPSHDDEGSEDDGAELEQEDERDADGEDSAAAGSRRPDKNDRDRTEMAARADRNDRGRTEMAAGADKNDRATSLEQPMNQSSLRLRAGAPRSPPAEDDERERVRAELDVLRRWRRHGGDPEGLGAWPTPTPPGGVALPRLALGGKLPERLREDRSAEEIHRAVHLVAELVEAGELPPDKWRPTYVFSGWLDELVVKAMAVRAKRVQAVERAENEAKQEQQSRQKPEVVRLSRDEMLETLAELEALKSVGQSLQTPTVSPTQRRRRPDRESELELLNLRIEVHAVAEQLGREPRDILAEFGRGSMRELELGDALKLRQLLREASHANAQGG